MEKVSNNGPETNETRDIRFPEKKISVPEPAAAQASQPVRPEPEPDPLADDDVVYEVAISFKAGGREIFRMREDPRKLYGLAGADRVVELENCMSGLADQISDAIKQAAIRNTARHHPRARRGRPPGQPEAPGNGLAPGPGPTGPEIAREIGEFPEGPDYKDVLKNN
jgi:hypothetical protein